MTDALPETIRDAFQSHNGYELETDHAAVTTTAFEGRVTATDADADWAHRYTVTVVVPSLSAAVGEVVGPAVADGWFDTLQRRLEDAPKATRASVDLETFEVDRSPETVQVTYEFTSGDARQAADIAKTFVEYVEGTYVEGAVPGYDYEPPVADLLNQAQSGGSQGDRGGTPL
ncbi:MAG: DUF5813 family protein [Halapricum sp.]